MSPLDKTITESVSASQGSCPMRADARRNRERWLAAALMATQDKTSELFVGCHQAIHLVGGLLLDNAKRVGAVRPDVSLSEVLRLINAIGLATEQQPDRAEQAGRLVTIVLDG